MSEEHLHFYLIPGMGANASLYSNYHLGGVIHALDWPSQRQSITLADYAAIIAEQITTKNNVIVGSSMGGMVATELSHLIAPRATILLSAPCSNHQFPFALRMLKHMRLHRLLGPNQIYSLANAADLFMGFQSPEDRKRFYDMLKTNGPDFLHFSIRAVLEWEHLRQPTGNFLHILGDRDRLFNPKKIHEPLVIRGAGHFATFEKSKIISQLIQAYVDHDFDKTVAMQFAYKHWPNELKKQ
ncbi:MAG: hypothetical protein RLZZ262_639 [Bacteroidota bacterium]|jgi:pimeloyl-ACP methyl ester carboxylesterase